MTVRETALAYADRGMFVFPCRGKRPLVEWREFSSIDPDQIERWWDNHPDANVGIDCGPSRIAVIDVDQLDSLEQMSDQLGWRLEEADTLIGETGGGGLHIVFADDPSRPVRNSASKLAPGIDVRGNGGYIVAPPSTHPDTGQLYRWIQKQQPAELPDDLRDLCEASKPQADYAAPPEPMVPVDGNRASAWSASILNGELDSIARAAPGTRNNTLYEAALKVGGVVKGGYLEDGPARAALIQAGVAVGQGRGEAEATVDSGFERADVRHPEERPLPEPLRQQNSSSNPPEGRPDRNAPASFRAMSSAEIEQLPPPQWLIEGLLTEGLTFMVAPPKAGKTFIALDWACTLAATGRTVLMFAGEGVSGLGVRLQAWKQAHPAVSLDNLHIVPTVPKFISSAGAAEQYVATIHEYQPDLVIIDTLARALLGGDENSSHDVGLVIGAIDQAREEVGCSTLVLHHPGKSQGASYRGSGAIEGALDCLIRLTPASIPGSFTLQYDAVKDAEPPQARDFQLRRSGPSVVVFPSALR